jgi:hypothetical protein
LLGGDYGGIVTRHLGCSISSVQRFKGSNVQEFEVRTFAEV